MVWTCITWAWASQVALVACVSHRGHLLPIGQVISLLCDSWACSVLICTYTCEMVSCRSAACIDSILLVSTLFVLGVLKTCASFVCKCILQQDASPSCFVLPATAETCSKSKIWLLHAGAAPLRSSAVNPGMHLGLGVAAGAAATISPGMQAANSSMPAVSVFAVDMQAHRSLSVCDCKRAACIT